MRKTNVRISHELRRHIEMVDRMASRHRNAMRISTFNAQQLEGLVESGMDVTTDQTFTTLVNRIREAQETDIRIPRNIQADLRSYQKEGYADGLFHIQAESENKLETDNHCWLWLEDTAGNRLECLYSTGFSAVGRGRRRSRRW